MGHNNVVPLPKASNYGSIDLTLSKAYFLKEEGVIGKVKFNAIMECYIKRIYIRLLGKERIGIYTAKREVILIDKTMELDKSEDVMRGKLLGVKEHEYNFTMDLKGYPKLPSGILCKGKGKRYFCEISYNLEAVIEFQNSTQLRTVEPVNILEEFKVEACKKSVKAGTLKSNNEVYGEFIFSVTLNFTGILVNAGFEMEIDYDNRDCDIPVKNLDIKIVETTSLNIKKDFKAFVEERVVGKWKLNGIMGNEAKFFDGCYQFTNEEKKRLESVTGSIFKRYYTLIVEANYNNNSINNRDLKAEFGVVLTKYYESTRSGLAEDAKERN